MTFRVTSYILIRFLLNLTRPLYIGTSTDESDYLVASYDTLNLTKRRIDSFNVPTPQGTIRHFAQPLLP